MTRNYRMELVHFTVCMAIIGFGGTFALDHFVPLNGWLGLLGLPFGAAAIIAAAVWDGVIYDRQMDAEYRKLRRVHGMDTEGT